MRLNNRNNAFVIAVLLGVIQASPVLAAAAKAPKIVFKEDFWNFGRAKAGEDLIHEFVFKNEGDAPLNLSSVETSCGCTAALVSEKTVKPGKSGRIKVTFGTRGYSGEVVRYVYVESDDPNQPRIQLKVAATIDVQPQPRIDLDRYSFDGGLLVEGEDLTAPVLIRNKGELELKVECSLPGATFWAGGKAVTFPLRVAAGKDLEVSAKMPLVGRMGPVREFILVKSNDPLRATISVVLSGYIVTKEQLKQIFQKYKDIIR